MSKFIIIRGPLGCGKTTVARELAKQLNAKLVEIDKVLEQAGLDKVDPKLECIPAENFLKATENTLAECKSELNKGRIVIFDGCFYHKEQIQQLKDNLGRGYVFSLKAPLNVCIERDKARSNSYGEEAAKAVYELVSKLEYGIPIDVSKPLNLCVKDILKRM